MIGHYAYYQQVSELSFWTLKSCIPHDSTVYFRNSVKKPGEFFMNFLARVTEAVERRVNMAQLKTCPLTWEGLNAHPCIMQWQ